LVFPAAWFPGRVTWAHDPAAVRWNGTGSWWIDANNNQAVIDRMDITNADNYLREAALAHDPPSRTFYDPERDDIRCRSLGVHEHWNNGKDKKCSRNLGRAHGIELFLVS
jgi:hypothetical protein